MMKNKLFRSFLLFLLAFCYKLNNDGTSSTAGAFILILQGTQTALRSCCVTTTAVVLCSQLTHKCQRLWPSTHRAQWLRSAGLIQHFAAFSSEWAARGSSLQQVPRSASENPSRVLKAALCTYNVSLQQELNLSLHPSAEREMSYFTSLQLTAL